MNRSMLKFENAIKSEATKELYSRCLKLFVKFTKLKNPDDLLQLKDSYLNEMLEDYLFYLKKKVNPNSIPTYFAPIELFFVMNDKVLNFKKLRKMFPAKIKTSGSGFYQNEDVKAMLNNSKIKRTRAMIHFLASTGCRVGVLKELKMKHLEDYDLGCKKVIFYEGSTQEYIGFLTPEASSSLDEYFNERINAGEKFYPDSPVFRTRYFMGMAKAKPLGEHSIKILLYNIIKRNSKREKIGNRYNIQADHGFRKRFANILKSNDQANVSLVEKLLGHMGAVILDGSYYHPKHEVLFNEFRKHILNLTIDDSVRLLEEIRLKDVIIGKMESDKDRRITALETKLDNVEKLLGRIKDRKSPNETTDNQ